MTPDACRAFARYNRWMNAKVYGAAALMSDSERKQDRGAFFASIHGVMNHLLVADRIWLSRLGGVALEPGFIGPDGIKTLDHELAADFDTLRLERDRTDTAVEAWTASVTADLLASTLHMVRRGKPTAVPYWWAAMQMVNHQTHHRGQLTTLLHQAGRDPGVTDIFAMLNEERDALGQPATGRFAP